MKKSELKNIIRQLLKEQIGTGIFGGFNPPDAPPPPVPPGGFGTVSAKGCCKELHIMQRLINAKQEELNALEAGSGNPFWDTFSDLMGSSPFQEQQLMAVQAEFENLITNFNNIKNTGCCKQAISGNYK